MSLNQFEKWLHEQGVDRKNGRYYVPCAAGTAKGETDSALRVTMATRRKDRHGDILEPSGADTSAFLRNPVVLWAHQYDELPIGRVERIWSGEDAVSAEIIFDSRTFAREVLRLYREGFLSGWSVGFLPKKWQVIEDEGGKFDGYHITEWELIELSAVPVPANPEALTRELQSGGVQTPALAKALTQMLTPLDSSDPSDPSDKESIPPPETAPSKLRQLLLWPELSEPLARRSLREGGPPLRSPASRYEGGSDSSDEKSISPPEISPDALADALFPRLREKLLEWADAAATREIRRRQGRMD